MRDLIKPKKDTEREQDCQYPKSGLYVREDDQDWGSAGMNDVQKELDTNH